MANMFGSRIFASSFGVQVSGAPTYYQHVVDASNDGVAWAVDARTANAITHLGYRYGARTGTPPTHIIGLEGISVTTGFPDGTYLGGGSPASATFTPPADTTWDGTWQWVALANSYTPAIGERMTITIRYSSGTVNAGNNSSFSTAAETLLITYPYRSHLTAGTWVNQTTGAGLWGIRTATERYGRILPNVYSTRTASTVGHRIAMLVNIPGGAGDTYTVAGFRAIASIAAAAGKAPLAKIWSASTALASKTMDTDQVGRAASGAQSSVECIYDTSVTLNCGTDYYFGFEVADAANAGVILYGTQFASADDAATDDAGAICSLALNTGSWSADATVRPWMELILSDLTEPAGGAIAIVNSRRNTLIGR